MHNLENEDKILKIFSRVRCFNRDQLPRYADGRLTHVEKHLLEQHLVNCELCSDAIQIIQKPKFKSQYQSMGLKVQQYIRNSTYNVPQVYRAERYQKKEKNKESVLIYFWGAVAAALLMGCIYLIREQVEREKMEKSFVKTVTTPVAIPEAPVQSTVIAASFKVETDTIKADKVDSSAIVNEASGTDKSLYKTAMTYFQQGNLDEAMPRFTQLTTATASRYSELASYQLAICFKFKGQKAKARRMFKDLVNSNGSMKRRAQLALNKL